MGRNAQKELNKDLILPLVVWNRNQEIDHWISCLAVTPQVNYVITGSCDGDICIWDLDLTEASEAKLLQRCISTGHGGTVSCITASNTYFLCASSKGDISHFQLPDAKELVTKSDPNHLLTSMVLVPNEDKVLCCGFFPYIILKDALTLNVIAFLKSSLETDWISWVRPLDAAVQAITLNGILKTWPLVTNENKENIYESSSGKLVDGICRCVAFSEQKRLTLVVTTNEVTVFDSRINTVFKYTNDKEILEGGDFVFETIMWWSKSGSVYSVRNLLDSSTVELIHRENIFQICVVGNKLVEINNKYYFIIGSFSKITIYHVVNLNNRLCMNLVPYSAPQKTQVAGNSLCGDLSTICSYHIAQLNKYIGGCSDGSLIVYPATELILHCFFNEPKPTYQKYMAHRSAVLCLMYPHSEDEQYNESLFISGGADYTICVWDLFKNELVHRFCVQGGPIIKLMVTPAECKSRIANAVGSISEDHSIAIFSLRERRCVFLASCHPFPIVTVRWKPSHDFMIVKCYDGTIFVWELRTGRLDRIISGIAAEEVIYAVDEDDSEELCDFYTKDHPVQDALHRRLFQVAETNKPGPVQICGVLSSAYRESYVILLNITSLAYHLKQITSVSSDYDNSSFSRLTSVSHDNIHTKISNMISAIKSDLLNIGSHQEAREKKATGRKVSEQPMHQILPLSQISASLLHDWGTDLDLDHSLTSQGLFKPIKKVALSHRSLSGCYTLTINGPLEKTLKDFAALCALQLSLSNLPFSNSSPVVWKPPNQVLLCQRVTDLETLAGFWLNESVDVQVSVQQLLTSSIKILSPTTCASLLSKWDRYLPWPNLNIPDNLSLAALVLCCIILTDTATEIYPAEIIEKTGNSLKYLLADFYCSPSLRTTAISLIGRNFMVWESYIAVDEIIFSIFQYTDHLQNSYHQIGLKTLTSIAKLKINEVVATLKLICKTPHSILERSKGDILHIVQTLLENKNTCLDTIISDLIEVLIICIDLAHLKNVELSTVASGVAHFSQVDHSLVCQRIAVGLPDGKIVVHDLRSLGRCHVFSAHSNSVVGVKFSPDGKLLVSLCSSGTACVWQLSHGFLDLGLGQVRTRILKSFPTIGIVSNITSGEHLKVTWIDSKSIGIKVQNDNSSSSSLSTVICI